MMKIKSKKKKMKSKKGVTLLELIIGITLIVIIFTSTLGAMVGGYTTTLYNSDEARIAVLNSSLNEIIITCARDLRITADNVDTSTGELNNGKLTTSISQYMPEAVYVKPSDFANAKNEYQYTIIPVNDSSTDLSFGTKSFSIKGVIVKTRFSSAKGDVSYESFVPFAKA